MTTRKNWNKIAKKFLVGKIIQNARYLSQEEMNECFGEEDYGGMKVPLVIEFTDGSWIFPMSDDEGNDGGALATSSQEEPTLPVIGRSD
jgi:hypothetical protein|tara:strand:- start:141 stop:407 length:267 start_codon:yes stop_codon:yes gene_type:complete